MAYANMRGNMPLSTKIYAIFGTVIARDFRRKIHSTERYTNNATLCSGFFRKTRSVTVPHFEFFLILKFFFGDLVRVAVYLWIHGKCICVLHVFELMLYRIMWWNDLKYDENLCHKYLRIRHLQHAAPSSSLDPLLPIGLRMKAFLEIQWNGIIILGRPGSRVTYLFVLTLKEFYNHTILHGMIIRDFDLLYVHVYTDDVPNNLHRFVLRYFDLVLLDP